MNTPIYDFVTDYIKSEMSRLHMPGHKGVNLLGCECWDITEISGADSLYEASGIIRQSEQNVSALFETGETFYSTEGSSQCIKAMLYLALLANKEKADGVRPVIIAARNAHRAFISAAALLDFDIIWLCPENSEYSLCRCDISKKQLTAALQQHPEAAGVYITSPDYLGNIADIKTFSQISHRHGVPLLVDNAHGAYLKFLTPSHHPIDLGADICCDSAHKTLPVLTGGAYLHVSKIAGPIFTAAARQALALFGSTSPSYIILQSLDLANKYIADGYSGRLLETVRNLSSLKARLSAKGWSFSGNEPLKLTLNAKKYGYTGIQLSEYLYTHGIVCEYSDPDYTVLMPGTENRPTDFTRLETALSRLQKLPEIQKNPLTFSMPETAVSIRESLFSPSELLPAEKAIGRICAQGGLSCPPAVAPIIPGEIINSGCADILKYYGTETVAVLKKER